MKKFFRTLTLDLMLLTAGIPYIHAQKEQVYQIVDADIIIQQTPFVTVYRTEVEKFKYQGDLHDGYWVVIKNRGRKDFTITELVADFNNSDDFDGTYKSVNLQELVNPIKLTPGDEVSIKRIFKDPDSSILNDTFTVMFKDGTVHMFQYSLPGMPK